MEKPEISILESVELREYWKDESNGFTPWLADNIHLLSKVLGIDLEVEAQEKEVGPFRADVLCKEKMTNHWVLIENQLEMTDHNHLGQILTYAAGLEAFTIIWVARQFTAEHRATLDWLNRITASEINFFGIEIELWKIGDSPAAPNLKVVSQPNDWSKQVREGSRKAELTPGRKHQLEFWKGFKAYLEEKKSIVKPTQPLAQHWMNHSIFGRSGFKLNSIFSASDSITGTMSNGELRVELQIDNKQSNQYFTQLQEHKLEIEEQVGSDLTWYNQQDILAKRIYIRKSVDIYDISHWEEYFAWLKDNLEKFKQVFAPRISKL